VLPLSTVRYLHASLEQLQLNRLWQGSSRVNPLVHWVTPAVPCLMQDAYQAYEQHFKDSPPAVLRDCLELKSGLDPISIDEVCLS
jgi:protoheme ferro-lyase